MIEEDLALPFTTWVLGGSAMSAYQYYVFLAVDRPLTATEQAEVRQLSTRARITATSFTNEYHWGDLKGSPDQLMQRYYDAHLYLANWGTHRIMLRVPRTLLDPNVRSSSAWIFVGVGHNLIALTQETNAIAHCCRSSRPPSPPP
jgi:hypothetical protein